ncbi:hypothetical protein MC885_005938 [Smutsia gigantea]|nr:hypothetical protein MC885_005938 [Smutsia gigantea]
MPAPPDVCTPLPCQVPTRPEAEAQRRSLPLALQASQIDSLPFGLECLDLPELLIRFLILLQLEVLLGAQPLVQEKPVPVLLSFGKVRTI